MYLEHFLTTTVKLQHKSAFYVLNYIHCIPAIFNAYTQNKYMINYTLGYYMFEIVYLLKYHLPVKRTNIAWYIHTIASFYTFSCIKDYYLGAWLITWNIGCRKLLPAL